MAKDYYTSKEGLRFRIVPNHRPNEGDIVHFTRIEYDAMKQMNLKPEEFKVLYMLKMADFRYDPKPTDFTEAARLAIKYGDAILKSLKGNKDVEKEVAIETEVREQEGGKCGI